jgi:hypothetical protein
VCFLKQFDIEVFGFVRSVGPAVAKIEGDARELARAAQKP